MKKIWQLSRPTKLAAIFFFSGKNTAFFQAKCGVLFGIAQRLELLAEQFSGGSERKRKCEFNGGELKMKKHMEDDPWGQQYAGMGSSSPVTSMY
jgi:hypothetical protein